jgi:hypothetical protein
MYIGSLPLAFAFSVLLAIWQYAMLACWKHNARIIYWQAKLPFCHIAGNTEKRIIAVAYSTGWALVCARNQDFWHENAGQ